MRITWLWAAPACALLLPATRIAEPRPAPLIGASGDTLGSVELESKAGALILHLRAHTLAEGKHGMHLHTNGSCIPPDFKSAGGHFNPLGKEHGRLNPNGAHAGDLGNLTVAHDGSARADITLSTLLRADLLTESGGALVIHASPDDEKTDPSGNSGDRIACAVLKVH